MKGRLLLFLVTGGLILASLLLLSTGTAYASCHGPNDPNPCPPPAEGEREKKIKTPVPPTSTDTPTALPTPTSTRTPTRTPAPSATNTEAPLAGGGLLITPDAHPTGTVDTPPFSAWLLGLLLALGTLAIVLLPRLRGRMEDLGPRSGTILPDGVRKHPAINASMGLSSGSGDQGTDASELNPMAVGTEGSPSATSPFVPDVAAPGDHSTGERLLSPEIYADQERSVGGWGESAGSPLHPAAEPHDVDSLDDMNHTHGMPTIEGAPQDAASDVRELDTLRRQPPSDWGSSQGNGDFQYDSQPPGPEQFDRTSAVENTLNSGVKQGSTGPGELMRDDLTADPQSAIDYGDPSQTGLQPGGTESHESGHEPSTDSDPSDSTDDDSDDGA